MRYFIEFSYNGTPYFGYQIQPKEISVQQVLENALSTILREEIKITGAGRTDTGVHAKKMFAHFDFQNEISEKIVNQLNSFLPPSIAVHKIFKVRDHLHARFDATYRTYEYYIALQKNPFTEKLAWQHWKKNIDMNLMNKSCGILLNNNDFTSFAKLGADNTTNFCEIYTAKWEQNGPELKFTISANRFLRNMVRAIVGTMVEIGTGKIHPQELQQIIDNKNRNSAGTSAPAHGLFLVDVGYHF